ncbi:hypothetical protein FNF27_08323 [Cafeteria roenbergensis]|uniref:Uncharacterized protein n=2 Tax=Cafeteria roenbergensis TaxID=33653 RepID=A0A5A8D1F2_CAFRO|nr:hypothetical protein FNF29_01692 [Cafeteria roenbergensis]KAA0159203.1 hypothetical protein FNF27_08323 [Cafeteria roenbergensis]KAA0160537.1 hypothetical protein FNF31_04246 [Cafeteria roenbergensis]KAA0163660.1 hypothetical protein FNF28_04137 [Cafeteria roenbergensis]|eukprot:KAA0155777.1 hypothetical protein FNF29_01692 [Cafeteria roenbergensis]
MAASPASLFGSDGGRSRATGGMPGPDVPGPDLLSGAGGWRNIQAVIRSAIASLAHRMEACERDGAALRDAMGDAPRFADLHQAVSQRASTEDLETMGLGLQDQLSRRADALAERLAASQRDNHRLQERVASLEARIEACERRSAAAEEALAAKAEVSSLAGLVTAAELDAAGLLSRRDVEAMLASRVTRQELSDVADGLATRRDAEETRRLCEERPGRTEVREFVESALARAGEETSAAARRAREAGAGLERVEAELADCVRRADFEAQLGRKVGGKALEARLARATTAAREGAERAVSEGLGRLGGELRRRPTAEEVARALEAKADADEVRSALASKADAAAVAEAIRRKAEAAEVAGLRATLTSLAASGGIGGIGGGGGGGAGGGGGGAGGWAAAAARLEALLENKADSAELGSLRAAVDARPSTAALEAVERRAREAAAATEGIDARVEGAAAAAEEAAAVASDARKAADAAVSRVERVETQGPLVGRWVWKSRELREGGLVPWEHEAENTDEEALVWEGSGSTRVVAARPGLYRCCVGMFSGRAPVVTILVDGSPVVTCAPGAAADASKRLGASGRGAGSPRRSRLGASTASVTAAMAAAAAAAGAPQSGVTLHRHPVGSVAGLSLVQFLALPQRAAVSVMFEGEVRGQGFLELKKL